MVFSEFEIKRCQYAIDDFMKKRRPPPHIRKDLDLGYRIQGQSVEIFEIRPRWQDPKKKIEIPVAKGTYVKTKGVWKVYWQKRDMKWHLYKPNPEVKSIEEFLDLVDRDEYACFWG
jgi:hypothetical protein